MKYPKYPTSKYINASQSDIVFISSEPHVVHGFEYRNELVSGEWMNTTSLKTGKPFDLHHLFYDVLSGNTIYKTEDIQHV